MTNPNCQSYLSLGFGRITKSSIPVVPHTLFGDFNFRLDNKRVVEVQYRCYEKKYIYTSNLSVHKILQPLINAQIIIYYHMTAHIESCN